MLLAADQTSRMTGGLEDRYIQLSYRVLARECLTGACAGSHDARRARVKSALRTAP